MKRLSSTSVMRTGSSSKETAALRMPLLMIKDQVPMSKEIQHIIDFVGESKLGIVKINTNNNDR